MNTYVQNNQGSGPTHYAIRASRAEVARLSDVVAGRFTIVPATKQLRDAAARHSANVPTLRILANGKLGFL